MSEANTNAARTLCEMIGGGDLSQVEALVASNMVDHEAPPGMDANGPEGFRRTVAMYQGAFPDVKLSVLKTVAEGDMVALHFRATGTNTGEFMGMPATGKAVDFEGVDLMRFVDGKIVEHWGFSEQLKMMAQLGMHG
jgi:steroid delta-isomerase-like uncharacterized protein